MQASVRNMSALGESTVKTAPNRLPRNAMTQFSAGAVVIGYSGELVQSYSRSVSLDWLTLASTVSPGERGDGIRVPT